jgi:acetyl-CoA C-acetyltransferase/acetyl-CoA acyltransferase
MVSIPPRSDEVILGNVGQPSDSTNIARVVALLAGVPEHVPAVTVQRNCASGMEAIVQAHAQVASGQSDLVLAGGTESMSQIPLYVSEGMTRVFEKLSRAKSFGDRVAAITQARPKDLQPRVAIMEGLTDRISGLNMGRRRSFSRRKFGIQPRGQDDFALQKPPPRDRRDRRGAAGRGDHARVRATVQGGGAPGRGPAPQPVARGARQVEAYFDRRYGTVTPGNSCGITDGAAAIFVAIRREGARAGIETRGTAPVVRVRRTGSRPHGTRSDVRHALALRRGGVRFQDIGLIEINEAFGGAGDRERDRDGIGAIRAPTLGHGRGGR